jgi:hypothetical protein
VGEFYCDGCVPLKVVDRFVVHAEKQHLTSKPTISLCLSNTCQSLLQKCSVQNQRRYYNHSLLLLPESQNSRIGIEDNIARLQWKEVTTVGGAKGLPDP